MTENGAPLVEIVIRREGGRWTVIRRREKDGETLGCDDLEDCFDTIRQAYDKDGNPRSWPKPLALQTQRKRKRAVDKLTEEAERLGLYPGTEQPSNEKTGNGE